MDYTHKIKECGLKATPGRVTLLEQLYNAKEPLSYEDLKTSISIDKATFYRSMATFEEKNIVNGFEFPDKRRYYEYKKDDHSHFICLECSKVECLAQDAIVMPGYEIATAIIKGKCKECIN